LFIIRSEQLEETFRLGEGATSWVLLICIWLLCLMLVMWTLHVMNKFNKYIYLPFMLFTVSNSTPEDLYFNSVGFSFISCTVYWA